jgi:hypothetical protein
MVKAVEKKRVNTSGLSGSKYLGGVSKVPLTHNGLFGKRTYVNPNNRRNVPRKHFAGANKKVYGLLKVVQMNGRNINNNNISNGNILKMLKNGRCKIVREKLSEERLVRFWKAIYGTRYHNNVIRQPGNIFKNRCGWTPWLKNKMKLFT